MLAMKNVCLLQLEMYVFAAVRNVSSKFLLCASYDSEKISALRAGQIKAEDLSSSNMQIGH